MAILVMMRHGQSVWNKLNVFTGWVDVPLSQEGVDEAYAGGKEIADIPLDVIFTSTLIRAQMTAMIAMLVHKSGKVPVIQHEKGKLEEWGRSHGGAATEKTIPVYEAWELNERYYGDLQGQNKDEMRARHGAEQVHIWRRSYDVPPPHGEALKNTAERTKPYFWKTIVPRLEKGQNVFIAAHGNSLRSIVMDLDNLSPDEVVKLEIPTGAPLIYEFQDGEFVKCHTST
ncbi:MAG: 2,3-bisphosphoglycerate-dependent phosphoglycerate mutase [Parachlamydiales bacterium]